MLRRIIVLGLLAIALARHVSAQAPQTISISVPSATQASATFTGPNTPGAAIVIGVRIGAVNRIVKVTDDGGNMYTQDGTGQVQTADGHQDYFFHAANIAVPTTGKAIVTVSISGTAASIRFAATEVKGLGPNPTLDGITGAQGNGKILNSGAITTTGTDVIFGQGGTSLSTQFAVPSPWTAVENTYGKSGVETGMILVNAPPATYGAVLTAQAAGDWTAEIIAFKPDVSSTVARTRVFLQFGGYTLNPSGLNSFPGCAVSDTACTQEITLCDQNTPPQCMHFPPGHWKLTASLVAKPTSVTVPMPQTQTVAGADMTFDVAVQ
jgi:hypothetical protein